MSNNLRCKRPEIKELRLASRIVGLLENQYFCETEKAYEIWDVVNSLERRIKRIPKQRVFFVYEK